MPSKFGPRKGGATKFVQEMVADIASKRRWMARALGIREDDPALNRRIQQLGEFTPGQLGGSQQAQQAYEQARERQLHVGLLPQQMQRPVAVSDDGTWLEIEMVKTINRGRSLLHSVFHEPGKARR